MIPPELIDYLINKDIHSNFLWHITMAIEP